jgi:hypothetical protein
MVRPVPKASRKYLESKFAAGYSPSAVREAHNHLTTHRQREPFPLEQGVYGHRKLSETDVTRAYDRWRVYARRNPGSREATQLLERRTRNQERLAEYQVKVEQRKSLGLPAPPPPIKAADAGMVYRVTHEERWREHFEEGSP